MSFDWLSESRTPERVDLAATGFPGQQHPAEPDLYCRQEAMPGHQQLAIAQARIAVVGCGGLGSWIALGLARMGVAKLTLLDGDVFDRSNAPRQLMFPDDLQQSKAHSLAKNLVPHMTSSGRIVSIAKMFDRNDIEEKFDLLVVGVDDNRARLDASGCARAQQIPAVFAMLSTDGLRTQVFLQRPQGPCLSCVLPDLDQARTPCAAASITRPR